MFVASRFAGMLLVVWCCILVVGCSSSGDTTPASEIPEIPPSTRSLPGHASEKGGESTDFIPAPPPR